MASISVCCIDHRLRHPLRDHRRVQIARRQHHRNHRRVQAIQPHHHRHPRHPLRPHFLPHHFPPRRFPPRHHHRVQARQPRHHRLPPRHHRQVQAAQPRHHHHLRHPQQITMGGTARSSRLLLLAGSSSFSRCSAFAVEDTQCGSSGGIYLQSSEELQHLV